MSSQPPYFALKPARALALAVSLLASGQASAQDPLNLPAQLILGGGQDSAEQTMPLARHTLQMQDEQATQLGANLSETLQRVPGLSALNRENYAQDLQISSRGFGARSQFGVRGVRLVQDGIPLTMPDGQGQPALFDLDGLQRLEVLRGPLTTLYGNASGGIIQGYTADGSQIPTLDARVAGGPDSLLRSRIRYGGQHGDLNISGNASRLSTSGYRDHSKTHRNVANLRLGWDINDLSRLTLVFNSLDQPLSQDPLGLTADQVREDRRQVAAVAKTFNTRKSVRHQQMGINYQQQLSNDDEITVMLYGGNREMLQYLAFKNNGVVQLERRFGGGELGWKRQTELFGLPVELASGVTYNYQGEQRKGKDNEMGIKGQLKRDEYNRTVSREAYLISTWELAPRWQLVAGIRHNRFKFDSHDDFLTDGKDDSGSSKFNKTNPAAGLNWQWTDQLSLYVAAGQGFETPTLQEVAYRPDGQTGFNSSIKPSVSRNGELGAKWRSDSTRIDVALFHTRVKDEIVTFANVNGRATYANAARSTRKGLEFSIEQKLAYGLTGYLAYTLLDATYDSYNGQNGKHNGRTLPGVARHTYYSELAWQPRQLPLETAIELQGMSKRYATDSNQHATGGYHVFNWRASYRHEAGGFAFEPFVRVNNLNNKAYIGSLIVNGSGDRYYEPAPRRNWLAGIGVEYRWD
ncbi:MAG: TonB-dependent receptor [Gammaproteobacteria bacterium]|nr:TonB-dependent receptor [Gammaproteobacteria bacterium]